MGKIYHNAHANADLIWLASLYYPTAFPNNSLGEDWPAECTLVLVILFLCIIFSISIPHLVTLYFSLLWIRSKLTLFAFSFLMHSSTWDWTLWQDHFPNSFWMSFLARVLFLIFFKIEMNICLPFHYIVSKTNYPNWFLVKDKILIR